MTRMIVKYVAKPILTGKSALAHFEKKPTIKKLRSDPAFAYATITASRSKRDDELRFVLSHGTPSDDARMHSCGYRVDPPSRSHPVVSG